MANREIKFYKHYFNEFYVAQTEKAERLMKEYFESKESKD